MKTHPWFALGFAPLLWSGLAQAQTQPWPGSSPPPAQPAPTSSAYPAPRSAYPPPPPPPPAPPPPAQAQPAPGAYPPAPAQAWPATPAPAPAAPPPAAPPQYAPPPAAAAPQYAPPSDAPPAAAPPSDMPDSLAPGTKWYRPQGIERPHPLPIGYWAFTLLLDTYALAPAATGGTLGGSGGAVRLDGGFPGGFAGIYAGLNTTNGWFNGGFDFFRYAGAVPLFNDSSFSIGLAAPHVEVGYIGNIVGGNGKQAIFDGLVSPLGIRAAHCQTHLLLDVRPTMTLLADIGPPSVSKDATAVLGFGLQVTAGYLLTAPTSHHHEDTEGSSSESSLEPTRSNTCAL